MNKELVKIREEIKSKKPTFVACESWRYKRIRERWKKPTGIDNKMRKRVKGWPKLVKIGYGSYKPARYLHPSGYRDVIIHNIDELLKLDKNNDAARIGATVGKRKRLAIIKKAKELDIKVLNP